MQASQTIPEHSTVPKVQEPAKALQAKIQRPCPKTSAHAPCVAPRNVANPASSPLPAKPENGSIPRIHHQIRHRHVLMNPSLFTIQRAKHILVRLPLLPLQERLQGTCSCQIPTSAPAPSRAATAAGAGDTAARTAFDS